MMWNRLWKRKSAGKHCGNHLTVAEKEELRKKMEDFLMPHTSYNSLLNSASSQSSGIKVNVCEKKSGTSKRGRWWKAKRENGRESIHQKVDLKPCHLWQMLDENKKVLPIGAVAMKNPKNIDPGRTSYFEIWVRFDIFSILLGDICTETSESRDHEKCHHKKDCDLSSKHSSLKSIIERLEHLREAVDELSDSDSSGRPPRHVSPHSFRNLDQVPCLSDVINSERVSSVDAISI